MKLQRVTNTDGSFYGWMFRCPGCDDYHCFDARWNFDGDEEQPTFSPSLLVNGREPLNPAYPRCHSFVRKGKIEYLNDCTHRLAGHTVSLPEFE